MTVSELIKELKAIIKVHPEAAKAQVWATIGQDLSTVNYIGYDKRHKPPRLKLEA